MGDKPKVANMHVPASFGNQERKFAESVKENVDILTGQRGDSIDRAVTYRDLLDSGVIRFKDGFGNLSGDLDIETSPILLDVDIPPKVENLTATGAFRTIVLSWTIVRYRGHSRFEVFRSESNDFTTRNFYTSTPGYSNIYTDVVGTEDGVGKTFYYWVRAINLNEIAGPFSDVAEGVTQTDVNVLLDIIAGQVADSELGLALQTTINKIDPLEAVVDNQKSMYTVKIQASQPLVGTGFEFFPTTGTLSATAGSSTITINFGTGHSCQKGDIVNIGGAAPNFLQPLGGAITKPILLGKHIVTEITATTISFTAETGTTAVLANALDVGNGGTIALTYFAPYISGFGLSNDVDVDGNPTSAFVVNAEKFAIVAPDNASRITGNDVTKMPFYVTTTTTTDATTGIEIPAGVYMRDAFIAKANIVNLIAGQVTADFVRSAVVQSGTSILSPSINIGAITAKDANGNNSGNLADMSKPWTWFYGGSQRVTNFSVNTSGEMHANYGRLRGMEIRAADDTILLRSGGAVVGTGGSLINNGDFSGEVNEAGTVEYGNGWFVSGTATFSNSQVTIGAGSYIQSEFFPITAGETLYVEVNGLGMSAVPVNCVADLVGCDSSKVFLSSVSASGGSWDIDGNVGVDALTVPAGCSYGKIRITSSASNVYYNVYIGKTPRRIAPQYAATYIRNATVDTLQIAGNAVTIPDGDSNSSISINVGNSLIDVSPYTTFAPWTTAGRPSSLVISGQIAMGGADISNVGSKAATAFIKMIIEWRNSVGGYAQDVALSNSTQAYQSLFEGYGGQVVTNTIVAVPSTSYGVRIKIQARNQAFPTSGSNNRKATGYGFFSVAAKR